MEDIDIWRAAKLLMTQHGGGAKSAAGQRERAMFAKRDFEGAIVWRRVEAAIEELERQKPREGEAVN